MLLLPLLWLLCHTYVCLFILSETSLNSRQQKIDEMTTELNLKEWFNIISLTNLNTITANKVVSALIDVTSLKVLRLVDNDIDDNTVDGIAALIRHNHLMEELNISCNKFSVSGMITLTQALSVNDRIKFLNISENFKNLSSSEEIQDLVFGFAKCTLLQELNISKNFLTFSNLLYISGELRNHPNLQILDMSSNITSFFMECEFLVDVILSTNQLLTHVNVCGRNIRPRFTDDNLFPPLNFKENSDRFVLQNLYFTNHSLVNKFVQATCKCPKADFIEAKETCPFSDNKTSSYYVDHNGGTFYNQEHDFAIVIPPGAVLQGECIEIKATASHFGQYRLPNDICPISSYFWIVASYTFKVPVYLIMSHCAKIRSLQNIDDLCILQTCGDDLMMKEATEQVYFDYEIGYCVLAKYHFCSFCLGKKVNTSHYYFQLYYIHMMKMKII